MRSSLAALLFALGLVAPAAAVAGGPGIEVSAVRQSACCMPSGSTGPQAPTIADLCCCHVRPVAAHITHIDSATLTARANVSPAAVATATTPPARPIAVRIQTAPARARAPPLATLLAQHAALLC